MFTTDATNTTSIVSCERIATVVFVVPLVVYMPLYCGPPPPSGGTQVITW